MLLGVCGYLLYAGITRLSPTRSPSTPGRWSRSRRSAWSPTASRWLVLNRAETGSLNLRGAVNEVFADLLGSLLAVVAGVVI